MDFRKIAKAAKDQGWKMDRTTKGHPRFTPPEPDRPIVVFSGTPSDWRAVRNFLALMKQSGLRWPPPAGKASK